MISLRIYKLTCYNECYYISSTYSTLEDEFKRHSTLAHDGKQSYINI